MHIGAAMLRIGSNLDLTVALSGLRRAFLASFEVSDRLRKVAASPWIFAARKTCTKGGADGYPNLCRTRRKNASAGNGFGDTTQQIGNAREVENLWPAGNQRRTNQLFGRPDNLKFDRRTSGVGLRTPKNARIPEVRGRQRAAPNRQRVGRN